MNPRFHNYRLVLKSSKKPLYRTLFDCIRQDILSGKLTPDQPLMASRTLANILEVSRNTVNQAYGLLVSDGFIVSRQGAGYYVESKIDFIPPQKGHQNRSMDVTAHAPTSAAKRWLKQYENRTAPYENKPFALSGTDLDGFPFDHWGRLLSRRWRLNGKNLARFHDPMGYMPLREAICTHLGETRGVITTPQQVLIVSGAQQGLDLISRIMWEKGTRVAFEDPAYPGVSGLLKGLGLESAAIAVDGEGLSVEHLLNEGPFGGVMVTPSRNYPLGITMSLSRRLELLQWAIDHKAWIVEDDFDCDFRFDGPPLTALQGMAPDGRVLYVGSFSRILFSALRLGFVVIPMDLIPYFRAAKSFLDGHTSIVHQAALADFFSEGYFNSHLRQMKRLYAARRTHMISIIQNKLGDVLTVLPADGGLHICVTLNSVESDVKLSSEIFQKTGIHCQPLSGFYQSTSVKQGFVLAFAQYSLKETESSLDKLAEFLNS